MAVVTEAAFQRAVLDLAAWHGYTLVFHDNDPRRNRRGFPDLVLLRERDGRLLFAELKSATGKVRPEQARWLAALQYGGALAFLWRPADLEDGTIGRVLAE